MELGLAQADLPPAGRADATVLAFALQHTRRAGGAGGADAIDGFFPPVLEDFFHPRLAAGHRGGLAFVLGTRHETFLSEKTTSPVAGPSLVWNVFSLYHTIIVKVNSLQPKKTSNTRGSVGRLFLLFCTT